MGRMSRECDRFYKRLCELLADKCKVSSHKLSQWVRRKIFHSLIKSFGMCLRGSRKIWNNEEILVNSLSTTSDRSEAVSNINI